jgi:hypothetical protein
MSNSENIQSKLSFEYKSNKVLLIFVKSQSKVLVKIFMRLFKKLDFCKIYGSCRFRGHRLPWTSVVRGQLNFFVISWTLSIKHGYWP